MKFFLSLALCVVAASASVNEGLIQAPLGLSQGLVQAAPIGLSQGVVLNDLGGINGLGGIGLGGLGLNGVGLGGVGLSGVGLGGVGLGGVGLGGLSGVGLGGLSGVGLGGLGGVRIINPSIGLTQAPIGVRLVSVPVGVSGIGLNSGLGLGHGVVTGINPGLIGGVSKLGGWSGLGGIDLLKKKK